MSFMYEPVTKEQAERERYSLLEDGTYDAHVEKATAKVSSSGNNMIELVLAVYDKNGVSHSIFDFLVFTPSMAWRVIHFCESAGLMKEYEDKKFHPDLLIGRNVSVKIIKKKGNEIPEDKLNGKAPGARYPDKNGIEDYVKKETSFHKESPLIDTDMNDDIPF